MLCRTYDTSWSQSRARNHGGVTAPDCLSDFLALSNCSRNINTFRKTPRSDRVIVVSRHLSSCNTTPTATLKSAQCRSMSYCLQASQRFVHLTVLEQNTSVSMHCSKPIRTPIWHSRGSRAVLSIEVVAGQNIEGLE